MFLQSRGITNHLFFNRNLPKIPARSIASWADLRGTYHALPKHLKHLSPLNGAIFCRTKGINRLYQRALINKENMSATEKLVTSLFSDNGAQFRNTHLKSQPAFSLTPNLLADIVSYLNATGIETANKREQIFKNWKAQHRETTGHVPSNKQINALLDTMSTSKKENDSYPDGLTELILLSYLHYKSSSPDDLKTFLVGLKKNEFEIDLSALNRVEKSDGDMSKIIKKLPESDYLNFINEKLEDIFLDVSSQSYIEEVREAHYGYRGQSVRGDCVESGFHNLCNIIFYNEKTNQFDLSLLPQKPHKALCAFYEKNNFLKNDVNRRHVGQAFFDMLSGQTGFIYVSGNYELEATVDNFIPVMNFLFNIKAKTLKELSTFLSTKKRKIVFSKYRENNIQICLRANKKADEMMFIFMNKEHAYLNAAFFDEKGLKFLSYPENFLLYVEKNLVSFPLLFSLFDKRNWNEVGISSQTLKHLTHFHFPRKFEQAVDLFDALLPYVVKQPKYKSYLVQLIKGFPGILYNLVNAGVLKSLDKENIKMVEDVIFLALSMDNGNTFSPEIKWYFTCFFGWVDFTKTLLEKGVTPDALNEKNETPLHFSCAYSRLEIVKLLLEKGANANAVNDKKITPMHHACAKGCTEIVKLLLKNGADFKAVDANGKTPFDCAYINEKHDVMKVLIEAGVTFDEIRDIAPEATSNMPRLR